MRGSPAKRTLETTSGVLTLQVASQVEETSTIGGKVIEFVHLIRPSAMVARCPRDSGLYATRREPDTTTGGCPRVRTAKPSTRPGSRFASAATVVLCCGLLSGCVSETPLGKCVGLNGQPDSTLVYEYSAQNIALGFVGFELIYPPVKVALDELRCPVARRSPARAARTPERAR